MATIASILPRVRIHAPEAPEFMVNLYVVDALRDFCKRTRCWRTDLDVMDTDPGTSTYTLVPPTGAEVSSVILGEVVGGGTLVPKTARQLSKIYSDWRTVGGTPKYIRHEAPNVVRLVPIAQGLGNEDLYFTVSLIPTLDATTIDDRVVSEHLDAVVDGALSKLLAIQKKAWTNVAEANRRLVMYEAAIGPAQSRADAEYTKGVVRTVAYGGL